MANKFRYEVVLQGNYAHGWEDLCSAEDNPAGQKEIRGYRKDYQDNEGGAYRIIRRRVLNA